MNMRKPFITLLSFGLFMCAVAVKAQQAATAVSAYTPPVVTISGDTTVVQNCGQVSTRPVVHLTARASQGSTPVRYVWTTQAGTIEGNGPTATWTLDGVAPGYYRANLEALSGSSNDHCQVFASTLVLVECPPAPECPQLTVSCPSPVEVGKPIEFVSTVKGAIGNSPLVYNWTVSAGTIIEGQGTSSIKVSTAGLEGESITASASLAGYDAASTRCSASCLFQVPIAQTCRKFDEYPEISRNEEKARLDNLGVALQNDPFATAYVIVHPAENGKPGDVDRRSRNVTDYLINSRGMDGKRIVVQIGSVRPDSMVEIWLCPRGVTPKP